VWCRGWEQRPRAWLAKLLLTCAFTLSLQLTATPIDTKGFQSLLSLVDNTANDSFELYYGLFMYNQARRDSRCSFSLSLSLSLPWERKIALHARHGSADPVLPLPIAERHSGAGEA
jgi:hypothetical protein